MCACKRCYAVNSFSSSSIAKKQVIYPHLNLSVRNMLHDACDRAASNSYDEKSMHRRRKSSGPPHHTEDTGLRIRNRDVVDCALGDVLPLRFIVKEKESWIVLLRGPVRYLEQLYSRAAGGGWL